MISIPEIPILPAQFVAEYPACRGDTYHEDYYAWTWGDALFVVLDPYHYSMKWPNDDGQGYGGEGQDGEASGDRWDWTLGIQQYLWLKDTLENSNANVQVRLFPSCNRRINASMDGAASTRRPFLSGAARMPTAHGDGILNGPHPQDGMSQFTS